jgi:hypothetical protein
MGDVNGMLPGRRLQEQYCDEARSQRGSRTDASPGKPAMA